MAQLFHPSLNTVARVTLFGVLLLVALLVWAGGTLYRSPYVTREGVPLAQPIPFSHAHHVSDAGIDCRYCHTSVESSSFAGIPPTETCMNCHSMIWKDAPLLALVRESYRTGRPIPWNRVNYVPDFVFFNHAIHVAKGIGCTSCHGPVGQMPLTWQGASLRMRWCLDCHRDPAAHVRPREQVFNPEYRPPPNQRELGIQLVRQYQIKTLTDCWSCHR